MQYNSLKNQTFKKSAGVSQVALPVKKKNPLSNGRDAKDAGSIPGLGRSSGEGSGNALQYSCLESSMDRGAWWATVHSATKSQTQLSTRSPSTIMIPFNVF